MTGADQHPRNRLDQNFPELRSEAKPLLLAAISISTLISLIGLSFLVALSGCAFLVPRSEPTVVGAPGKAEGQWRGKALIKNHYSGKTGTISLEAVAIEPAQLRMEITGSFGVHLASIALDGERVTSILTQEKRFISAPATSSTLARLIAVRISPRALLAILFDRSLPRAEWKCDATEAGQLTACSHLRENLSVKWLEGGGGLRRIQIGSAEADVQMVIEEAKSNVQLTTEAFHLEPPADYQSEVFE